MNNSTKHLDNIKRFDCYKTIFYYIDKNDFSNAYRVANEQGGNQLPRELTMYLYRERGVFHTDPLPYLDYVPKYFLYEACDAELSVCVNPCNEDIHDFAFAYASIKRLFIPKNVKGIGISALSLNSGEIIYEGTKQDFIDRFLGKSLCFYGTTGQVITCSDGNIEIKG